MMHIGDLSIDTEVYLDPEMIGEVDRQFEIVRWADKEHSACTRLQLSRRELEKLHRLVKQRRRRVKCAEP